MFGSSCGGVNPTGASLVAAGASVFSSAAATLMERWGMEEVKGLGVVKEREEVGFQGRLVGLGVVRVGVKRPAWVAMDGTVCDELGREKMGYRR